MTKEKCYINDGEFCRKCNYKVCGGVSIISQIFGDDRKIKLLTPVLTLFDLRVKDYI